MFYSPPYIAFLGISNGQPTHLTNIMYIRLLPARLLNLMKILVNPSQTPKVCNFGVRGVGGEILRTREESLGRGASQSEEGVR